MASTVGQMTPDELRELVETTIEQKLIEMFGDPDEGLELKPELRERIIRQRQEYVEGKRGHSLDQVTKRMSLD